jgi:CheY-like chemotaxis protein
MTMVLLVDDEPDILTVLELLLTEHGYTVHTAPDGAEALRLARLTRPDLVLSDWMMPVMDGVSLLKALRATPELSEVPMLMMSAASPPQNVPFQGFLRKPFESARLLRMVRSLASG